jgi:tetratricopeptide (TPR) repeat protein
MPMPIIVTDCQIVMKDWQDILSEVSRADWGPEDYYRSALESLAERSLEQQAASDVSWHKALRLSAHRLDRLGHLAEMTRSWGWMAESGDVLNEIIDEFPGQKWAVDELASEYYAAGKTLEMEGLYFKIYSRDPSNPTLKNNLANLYLLRKTDLDKAYTMARDAYNSSTNNPIFASTYAYSLLLQDKKSEALNVLNGLKGDYLQIRSVALYCGVVEARSGRKEEAREALKRVELAKMLPEERAIVQLAESGM